VPKGKNNHENREQRSDGRQASDRWLEVQNGIDPVRSLPRKLIGPNETATVQTTILFYVAYRLDKNQIELRRRQQRLRPVKKTLRVGQVVAYK
jgi:hypothetical protein